MKPMDKSDKVYTVKQLSELAGVSVRALHHYDEIGLLIPSARSEANYRFYNAEDLFRLQQILFYRELDYGLKEIKEVLDAKDFDLIKSLRLQRKSLRQKLGRYETLITTIDKTINELKNQEGMITDKEMYEGFTPEEVERNRKEVAEKWGAETLAQTEANIKSMGKQEWGEVKQEAEEINLWLANAMHKSPDDIEVQKIIELHFNHINRFYEVSKERYQGLAELYVQDERFKANYDKVKDGLAEFLSKGMKVFCDNGLKVG